MYKILFIGLGKMGFPMAGYLSHQHDVYVYNRTKSKSDTWKKKFSGQVLDNLSNDKNKFDFIITCVGNDDDLREITSLENGCLNCIDQNTILIDHSTVSPKVVGEIHKKLYELGASFLDAPISGGQSGAEQGGRH